MRMLNILVEPEVNCPPDINITSPNLPGDQFGSQNPDNTGGKVLLSLFIKKYCMSIILLQEN